MGALAALLILGGLACATPVGVRHMDARAVHHELTRSALATREPSAYSLRVLLRTGLEQTFKRQPERVLQTLHETIRWNLLPEERLFALAELSFLAAERSGDREGFLSAALYAYAFLFPEDVAELAEPLDPRIRIAADLYNRALTQGLTQPGGRIELEGGRFALMSGAIEIDIDFDPTDLQWAGYELVDFQAAASLGVRGLRNRYRAAGIGAPLVAGTRRLPDAPAHTVSRVSPVIKVPVTALLRIEAPRAGLRGGRLRADLEVYAADVAPSVEIAGRTVPLEYEASSALAATLEDRRIWSSELQGFFGGDFSPFPDRSAGDGLSLLHPYKKGRVPVVFVHGTASSPARWAELVNEMTNVPILREHFQPWLFSYNTGQPIAYSAMLLREALRKAVVELDPEGLDDALARLIVVGHSQGGLLTKLTVISSGDRFRKLVSPRPLDELDLDPEARELLRSSLVFEPLPFVARVIFIGTPHRGSFLARWAISNWIRSGIQLPVNIMGVATQLVNRNPELTAQSSLRGIPSSVDNMTPDNPFLAALLESPIAAGVRAHSIIAVKGNGPVEEGSDGVVEYASAHLDGVQSEKVVRSGHSSQGQPETVLEVGRILLEHLDESGLRSVATREE